MNLSKLSSLLPTYCHYNPACLATGPELLPQHIPQRLPSRTSFSNLQYFLVYLKSLIAAYVLFSHPLYISFNNHCWSTFLCEMWPIHFTLNVLCVIDNQFATLTQQNAQTFSLVIYITITHWVFQHVSIHKGPSWGNQTKPIPHGTKFITLHIWHGVKGEIVKMLIFILQELCKCTGSWCTGN